MVILHIFAYNVYSLHLYNLKFLVYMDIHRLFIINALLFSQKILLYPASLIIIWRDQ